MSFQPTQQGTFAGFGVGNMKSTPSTKNSVLRQNQALLVLDDKGNFKCVYALRGEKVFRITYKGRKQICKTIYLEDLELMMKGKIG